MDAVDPVLLRIEKLIRLSRLREIEFVLSAGVDERVCEMGAALRQLQYGEYLLGTGPSTVGIIPLHSREVVLGRPPTILETPPERAADYYAVDTLYFVPREISRMHAKVMRVAASRETRHILIDMNSTCGTFVNGTPVDPRGAGIILQHGDVISLGPSQTSTYVYYRARRVESRADHAQTNTAGVTWACAMNP